MRQHYIDGEWGDSSGIDGIGVDSPVSGAVLDTVPAGTADDVRQAVEAARHHSLFGVVVPSEHSGRFAYT